MKLKLDANGNVVLENGHPVYVTEDGKEIAYDVAKLVNDLKAVNAESAGRRKDIDKLTEQLKPFEGLDVEKAKRGQELLALYEDGKLKDAGKVEEIRSAVEKSFQAKFDDQEKRLGAELATVKSALEAKDAAVKRMVVKGLFDASPFLKEKTTLPPDIAFASFGSMVEVEEVDGEFRAVGKLNGQPIFSRKDPGKPASGEEIIEAIIDSYPRKGDILKGAHGGGGTPSNGSRSSAGGGKTIKRAEFNTMSPTDQHAYVTGGGKVED